ncbi:MAG: DNA-binding protein [Rhodospirillales bacterium]|nr:DNA-binding protein [Alphaproteobacteria bacterium]MCB9986700.1 DNA-binding protein [Rhodospirillales bacterium]USO06775.1 MAG: DNA-binding protein [Rhodospirillales bacterium]
MFEKRPIVGVMGSHENGRDELAAPLGRALAGLGVHLLTGAGEGVMTTVSRAFVETAPRQGRCIGIVPTDHQPDGTFKVRQGYPNPYVEIPVFTPLSVNRTIDTPGLTRNHVNIMTSDIIIAMPGGPGTRNEIDLAIKFQKPLCLFGPHDLPSELIQALPHFETPDDAVDWVKSHLPAENRP